MPALGGNIATTIGTPGATWRQLDIMPMIINQSPVDTPIFEMIGTAKVKSREHYWQTRTLRARALRPQVEGSDFTYGVVATPSRVVNFTEIHLDGIEVSGSLQQEMMYGAPNVMKDQIQKVSVEHRNDWERSLIRSSSTLGDTDTAQSMDGLIAAAGNSTNSVGDTFTETKTIGMLQTLWENGSKPDTLVCGPAVKNAINAFAADSTRWLDKTTRELVYSTLVIHSDYGTVEVHLSRDLTSSVNGTNGAELLIFDRTQLKKGWFRTVRLQTAAITGDYERVEMIGEMTFVYDNDLAIYYWAGRVISG
jgi:hypothetical protein